ncbi:hypothetical protein NLG97_g7639 [Lecanicillium saksenae]|uniref:Uncharacterized protein n=1 Tax=Lecanicillium saksenae TaxID=468837 RepID=A0ACC1QLS6_9HYPO|nr:hypothetical protein NLG97_g7639 [Lecanicillium saksenae]
MASYTEADVMAFESDRSAPSYPPEPQSSPARDGTTQTAPTYTIPNKEIAAVEIPAVVQNIDRAVNAFGRMPSFEHLLDPQRNSIPLYLNPESPFCNPIMSHNSASHNVVLKIMVPKRTGRKRKRGSSGPWEGDQDIRDADQASSVCSIARQDEPKILKRKLQDNVGRYKVDAVGIINHTHRFRGLADFYWDMSTSSFANRYVDQVLSGDVEKMKAFTLEPGIDKSKNSDVIPPPLFTHMSLPFNYFYSQNPYVRTTADGGTVNVTAVKQVGYFISADDPTPTAPQEPPDVTDARFMEVLADLEAAFEDRPIWTRRSLLNHLGKKLDSWNELKKYLNYAAYQFKGGPWRDCVVPYGLDPRTHPKYREYQTVMFKLTKHKRPQGPAAVRTYRRPEKVEERQAPAGATSHIFDGETYDTDGKVWQVCDITDPLLRELLDGAAVRPTWDISSGWYHGGLWAKVKAIMKTKLVGIRFGRQLSRHDFSATLQFGDMTPPRSTSSNFHLPLPNLRLTDEELTALRGRKPPKKKSQGYNVKLYGRPTASVTDGPASVASSPSRAPMDAMENYDDSGADSNEENESGSELDDQLDTLVDDYNGQDYSTQEYHGQNYHGPYRCVFPTWKLLWAHKCAMRDLGREDHKSCTFCGDRFEVARSELLHVERSHEASQQLSCPGCGRGPFNRVGTLIAHIERGQCTSIGSRDLVRLREIKLDFHRELEKRSNEPVKGSFVSYMSNIHVEPWTDVVEAPSAVKPGVLTEFDFPGLPMKHTQMPQKNEPKGKTPQEVTVNKEEPQVPTKSLAKKWNTILEHKQDSKMPSSEKPASTNSGGSEWLIQLSPKQSQVTNWPSLPPPGRKTATQENAHGSPPKTLAAKWQGAWGTRDVQASIVKDGQKPRVTPTVEQLTEATRPSQMSVTDIDIDDPMNAYFRASNYFNTAINKYVCPKLGCGKYYDNKFQIINHLKSPAHGGRSYQCPRCSRIFQSVEAITSHAESPGHCRIRETEEYGTFLDQITGGIVQVDMDGSNDGVKYNVQQDVMKKVFW